MTSKPPSEPTAPPPGVRTTRRRGRTSPAKVAALTDLGPRWSVPTSGPWTLAAIHAAFERGAPLFVDIGVGSGEATRDWAARHPDASVLALELHRPGLARLLTDLEHEGPANVRVAEVDALTVLDDLPPASVTEVRVLFPDPWPKRRHVARRMVDRAFVAAVADVLVPGGLLHLATDWDDYAEHMRTMVATDARLVPVAVDHRPDRPVTAYEQRGLRAGRTITDLAYCRVEPSSPGSAGGSPVPPESSSVGRP